MPAQTPFHPRTDVIEVGDGRRVRLLQVLGRGGSSIVHQGLLEQRSGVSRQVAVKVFGNVSSDDAEHVFVLAARTAARAACIRHPNVVEVYDFGMWRGQPYFINELVEGVSLHALLEGYAAKSLRLPLDLALFIACEIGEALSGARTTRDHRGVQVGMLHLALGSRKVLLGSRGEVKVTDFETSMAQVASSSIRNLRAVAHRTTTMAPEVAHGQLGDARSDVFSLGVVLRELFVGPRFGRDVTNSEAVRLAREGFVQPMSFQPHLPPALLDVIERALQIDPVDRYPNASAMAFELRRVALAMGVGDGRLFLQRTLDRELGNDASEVTAERLHSRALPPPTAGTAARPGETRETRETRGRRGRREKPSPARPDDLVDLEALPTIAAAGRRATRRGGANDD